MNTTTLTILILASVFTLGGCSRSCEDIQQEIQEIGMEVQQDPGSAMDRSDELEALRQELQDKGCLGG